MAKRFGKHIYKPGWSKIMSWTNPSSYFSWTRWQSSFMCLIYLWKIGLWVIWRVAWLSQKSCIGIVRETTKSWRSISSQINSHIVVARARYSTSIDEWETTLRLFDNQEMGLVLSMIKNPLVQHCIVNNWPNQNSKR